MTLTPPPTPAPRRAAGRRRAPAAPAGGLVIAIIAVSLLATAATVVPLAIRGGPTRSVVPGVDPSDVSAAGPAGTADSGAGSAARERSDALFRQAEQILENAADDPDAGARARDLYLAALRADPANAAAMINLGVLYMERDDYASAVDMFERAADAAPSLPEPMYNLALCYDRRGFAWKALDLYALALERDPDHLDSLRGAIRAADRLQLADARALERIDRALRLETDPVQRSYLDRQRERVLAEANGDRERPAGEDEGAAPGAPEPQ